MNYYDGFEEFFAIFAGVAVFICLIAIAVGVFQIVVTWKVYKKAGKQGWEAIIPFYSTWVLNEIAGLNWWWFLISISGVIVAILGIPGLSQLASLASVLANINMCYNVCKKFNKDGGFFVLLALVPVVGYAILAFDQKCVFDSSVEVSNNGFFNSTTNTTNNSSNSKSTESSKSSNESKFCHNCGAKLGKTEKFCSSCGTKQD